ncbi:hypothetical protein BDU57DRAFT_297531 [Ampelomyces quisqualis]|uniref:Ubiquitin-like domain-containing protein n=1 Tax=Ampelomyces quisqualis TaxID=50730 RepID=A0A6A5QGR3_AMPQU|nr:hypothetical protein BDU57DRAFT_297531 [Ampelomyces quisqualis]
MAAEASTINLKILSPSAEVEGGVSFADLPTTTTVQELRSRIHDAVPSKPGPERMRLIYRGRVVANEAATLGAVFGADNIRESKDQSLHLVLRELPIQAAPRAATAPPNPFRPPEQAPTAASPPLHTNPFRTVPQPRPASQPQPQTPQAQPHRQHQHVHPPHVHHHDLPGPPNPFQVPLPHVLQQHLAHTLAMAQAQQMNNAHAAAAAPAPPAPPGQPLEPDAHPNNNAQAPPAGLPPLPGMGPPNAGRPVIQEGIGPNGERWSVSFSSATIPVQGPQPLFPRPLAPQFDFGAPPRHLASPGPAEALDRLLPRLRFILESARQDMENLRLLLQASAQPASQAGPRASTTPPPWRLERMRQLNFTMAQNLNTLERGLVVITADPSLTNNPDVIILRQSATELRRRLEEMDRTIRQQVGVGPANQAPSVDGESSTSQPGASTIATPSTVSSQPQSQSAPSTLPPNAPEELFLLSSPQGPVGILFDQRGTYTTAPMVQTLPFQTFTNQFAHNRQLIAGLGQQIAQISHLHGHNEQLRNQLANIQPTPTQEPAVTGQTQNQAQGADQGQPQAQNQPANPDANANPAPNAQGENDRVGNIAGHLWLVFKLACFVYFFSGTGWYKSLLLGLIAGGVYLAQIGMFEQQFALLRHHFEAVLPVGALAERAVRPAAEPRRNMTPEEAARRLLQQHQDQRTGWIRSSFRTAERSFAIFVASLWPGIGERMVHAQEERVRAERAAEEQRVRLEEEETKKRQEEAQKLQHGEPSAAEAAQDQSPSSAKGKEKAQVAPVESPDSTR